MEARICDNQIVVPIGTAISFLMIAKNEQKIDLKVVESEENSKFVVLFDENDVDFEIIINNKKCIHGIGYTLIVNNGFYDYYIGAGEQWSMEALYTKGRKLHFISQNSEEGQNVIQQTAQEYEISYSESAALCSRIEFNFEVEKVPEPQPKPFSKKKGGLPSFGSLSATRSLGQDVPDSSAVFGAQPHSNVANDESYDFRGMNATLSASVQRSLPRAAALAAVWKPQEEDKREEIKSKNSEPLIGDKGVVCFGEQSNQFYNAYSGFTKDKNLEIKPFVVELRFSKI